MSLLASLLGVPVAGDVVGKLLISMPYALAQDLDTTDNNT
jgi:hypothetical protein